jgi:chromosome segregation ATPase
MAIFSNIQHLINGVDIDTLLSQIEELTNKLKKEKAESCKSISTLSSKLEQAQKKNDNLKTLNGALAHRQSLRHYLRHLIKNNRQHRRPIATFPHPSRPHRRTTK